MNVEKIGTVAHPGGQVYTVFRYIDEDRGETFNVALEGEKPPLGSYGLIESPLRLKGLKLRDMVRD